MAIRKWTEVICDRCGACIRHYPADSIKEAVELAKKNDGAIVRYIVGKRQPLIFCDEECYQNWLKNNPKYCKD